MNGRPLLSPPPSSLIATVRAMVDGDQLSRRDARALIDQSIADALEVRGQWGDVLRDLLTLRTELSDEREVGG